MPNETTAEIPLVYNINKPTLKTLFEYLYRGDVLNHWGLFLKQKTLLALDLISLQSKREERFFLL